MLETALFDKIQCCDENWDENWDDKSLVGGNQVITWPQWRASCCYCLRPAGPPPQPTKDDRCKSNTELGTSIWNMDIGNMDLEYGLTEDDRCKSRTVLIGIWEKHPFMKTWRIISDSRATLSHPKSKLYLVFRNVRSSHRVISNHRMGHC